jgi:cytochrome c5
MSVLLRAPLFGVLLLGLAGCQTTPAGPSAAPPPLPAGTAQIISEADAAAGRRLYLNKCARCHKFYDPAAYDSEQWDKWMTAMSRKARLKAEERKLLEKFLGGYRASAD